MGGFDGKGTWALILGASSGMGLATAKKLGEAGMNLILVHRDRRGQLEEIASQFKSIEENGVKVIARNIDALNEDKRIELVSEIKENIPANSIKVLLHAVSKGNLKLMVQHKSAVPKEWGDESLNKLLEAHKVMDQIEYPGIDLNETDFTLTTQAMATSMLTWTQVLLNEGLFAKNGRVIGLTSEGDKRVWKGYGAVAAAKATLEAIAKYMAVEFAPKGLTTNILQAGITRTPSLDLIPGSREMMASAQLRNPMKRLTTPEDVANVVYLLAQDEANWINGSRIIVDGGEHLV